MKPEREINLSQIIEKLKRGSPPPGGAAVAALSAAAASGLVAMVCTIAARRKSLQETAELNRQMAEEAGALADRFLAVAQMDDEALKALMEAWALPRSTNQEREVRKEAIKRAAGVAAGPPLELAEAAVKGLDLASKARGTTGSVAPSDLATAGSILWAAGLAGLCNAAVNLASLSEADAEHLKGRLTALRTSLETAYAPIRALTDDILRVGGMAR